MIENLIEGSVFLLNGEIPIETADKILSWVKGSLAALGGVVLIYIVFNILNSFLNRRKYKEIENINKRLESIEKLLQKNLKKN